MKLDDIIKEWDGDCIIDKDDIIGESVKIPRLHNKYYKFYLTESNTYRTLEKMYKELEYNKWMLYSGKLEKEDLNRLGWEQCDIKTLKADIPRVIEADKDIQDMALKLGIQKDKIDYLKSIIQSISNRSFLFGHIIEGKKMEVGLV